MIRQWVPLYKCACASQITYNGCHVLSIVCEEVGHYVGTSEVVPHPRVTSGCYANIQPYNEMIAETMDILASFFCS